MSLKNADIILFDCDSTLTRIEGIDELGRRAGLETELRPLTNAAMNGELRLEEVYARRLEMIRPRQSDILWLGEAYIDALTKGAIEVIQALQQQKKRVHIISGGLKPAVEILAQHLSVADEQVHAVDIFFDKDGNYLGYDENAPLVHTGGKKTVSAELVKGGLNAVIIGDGFTDYEASQENVHFIGFGGVVHREAVENVSRYYIKEASLLPLLDILID